MAQRELLALGYPIYFYCYRIYRYDRTAMTPVATLLLPVLPLMSKNLRKYWVNFTKLQNLCGANPVETNAKLCKFLSETIAYCSKIC